MPKENRFEAEYAKSSMATCRVCMAKIPKGALRVGHLQVDADPDGGGAGGAGMLENDATAAAAAAAEAAEADKRLAIVAGATRWHHFECFPRMKGAKWMSANLPKAPTALKGFAEVKKADQKKLVQLWKAMLGSAGGGKATAKAKAKAGGKADDGTAAGTKRKATGKAEAPSSKRAKADASAAKMAQLTSPQGVLSAKDYKRVQSFESALASSTGAQLQAELELNKQVRGGKKDELVQRVAEGRVLGALPACPRCSKGQIHWSRIGGWHSCPGYYDREAGVQKRCYFRAQEMKRGKWKLKK